LKNTRKAQRKVSQRRPVNDEHAERDADRNRKRHSNEDESQMVGGGFEDFGAMLEKKCPGAHTCAPASGARDAVKARTSG